jgi:starch phosphorylase
MRLCIDEYGMDWDSAWADTKRVFAYTNHTLLPGSAGEMAGRAVSARCCRAIWRSCTRSTGVFSTRYASVFPAMTRSCERLSLIDEHGERYVRMANLACVGSRAINGVAALHSELLKQTVLQDFHELAPEKFRSVTNGVTPRRFLMLSNPGFAELATERIGDAWTRDHDALRALEPLAQGRRLPRRLAADAARCKTAARRGHPASDRHRRRRRFDVRRAGEAHSRVQAPAPEHPARDQPLRAPASAGICLRACLAPSSSAARRPPAITWQS